MKTVIVPPPGTAESASATEWAISPRAASFLTRLTNPPPHAREAASHHYAVTARNHHPDVVEQPRR